LGEGGALPDLGRVRDDDAEYEQDGRVDRAGKHWYAPLPEAVRNPLKGSCVDVHVIAAMRWPRASPRRQGDPLARLQKNPV
jgi:hypothetical protein